MESMRERGNLARSLDHGVLSRLAAESWRGMREASRTRVIKKKGSSMSESLPQFFSPCQKVLYESWAEGEERFEPWIESHCIGRVVLYGMCRMILQDSGLALQLQVIPREVDR